MKSTDTRAIKLAAQTILEYMLQNGYTETAAFQAALDGHPDADRLRPMIRKEIRHIMASEEGKASKDFAAEFTY